MIQDLFESQVERTPDAIALVFEQSELSYRELNSRANELAGRLRAHGAGPGVLVGIFVERSLDMVVGLLAILKGGGAYIPLDLTHPRTRIAAILEDAQPAVLLTQTHLQSKLPENGSCVITIDAAASPALEQRPARQATSERDLAYVIYTSGSTGKPKGVEIEHLSVINLLKSMKVRPGLDADDTMLAITTLSFDISVLEIFLPLTCGARVVIAGGEIASDGVALADFIERSGATVIQATPSTFRMLLDTGWRSARKLKILCGGEAWTTDLADRLQEYSSSVWNMYGPTETTVWSAATKVESGRPVAIGRPIANTRFYVLDSALQPVPTGVIGELCIGGIGLARGYLHQPDLTRERFVPDPYATESGARIYRTGDLVRRSSTGMLEFLGRADQQVKIRGHRIELGEIEKVLQHHPSVKHSAVVASNEQSGEQRLVAYVIPANGSTISAKELRQLLRESVPEYMVPSAFVPLDAFPLTSSGKLDRKALPLPDMELREDGEAPLAPRTPTEEGMAQIWREMLGLKQISIRENFFELGGHSLLAARLIGRINVAFNERLPVTALFRAPTIEMLSKSLDRKRRTGVGRPQFTSFQNGNVGLPLYFIGDGPGEYKLSKLIGQSYSIFGIEAPWPVAWRRAAEKNDAPGMPTMEELVAPYTQLLREGAQSRPCVIAGYSLHGMMAFEAAHQFIKEGGKVEKLILLDSLFDISPSFPFAALANYRRSLSRIDPADFWSISRWFVGQVLSRLRTRYSEEAEFGGIDEAGVPLRWELVRRIYVNARRNYHLRSLDSLGILIQADQMDEGPARYLHDGHGWNGLFNRGLKAIHVPGNHFTMLRDEANALVLAQVMRTLL